MEGGPSHLDTFDPKPLLNRLAGKPIPPAFGASSPPMGEYDSPILASQRPWEQHGQSGHLGVATGCRTSPTCADDLAVIRSCWADGINHSTGVCQMNTGSILGGSAVARLVGELRPRHGEPEPARVRRHAGQCGHRSINGPRNWGTGFMPAVYQGTRINAGSEPIPNLNPPARRRATQQQRGRLDFLSAAESRACRRAHAAERTRGADRQLRAGLSACRRKRRKRSICPRKPRRRKSSTASTNARPRTFGRMCLLARRLVERGVRFVQLYSGAGSKWDAHASIEENHSETCRGMRQAGRRPAQGSEVARAARSDARRLGRRVRPHADERERATAAITIRPASRCGWPAAASRAARSSARPTKWACTPSEDRLHVHDLHATILQLLGLDHMGLIYEYKGRPERPTLNEGEAFTRISG